MPNLKTTKVILISAVICTTFLIANTSVFCKEGDIVVKLPVPDTDSGKSLNQCLKSRRSVRDYGSRALQLKEVSQILWAAQGITSDWGGRTAPSAGALYPLRLYLVVNKVDELSVGVYAYEPKTHSLKKILDKDVRNDLMKASLGQACVGKAPINLVITAIPSITEKKYGDRSMRYIDIEVGCVCQNVHLECEAIGLGTVAIGAFYDDAVAEAIEVESSPRLIMPIGPRK